MKNIYLSCICFLSLALVYTPTKAESGLRLDLLTNYQTDTLNNKSTNAAAKNTMVQVKKREPLTFTLELTSGFMYSTFVSKTLPTPLDTITGNYTFTASRKINYAVMGNFSNLGIADGYLSIEVGAIYHEEAYGYDYQFLKSNYNFDFHGTLLTVPVLFKYTFFNKFISPSIAVGPSFVFISNRTSLNTISSDDGNSENSKDMGNTSNTLLSYTCQLGLNLRLTKHLGCILNGNYFYRPNAYSVTLGSNTINSYSVMGGFYIKF